MKAYIIGDENCEKSSRAMTACIRTATIPVERFQQVSASDITEEELKQYSYPIGNRSILCKKSNLVLHGRGYGNNIKAKIACTRSHMDLWNRCLELNEPIMILEHDALFTRFFEPFDFEGDILGLNDPRGATRKSKVFHDKVSSKEGISDCPMVDYQNVPQGLAGNSAYIIKPSGAKHLLNLIDEYGFWPNDAIMCNQLCPNMLKVVYPYYTKVQGVDSTTVK